MKKIIFSILLFVLLPIEALWCYNHCMCQSVSGNTLTIVTWYVEGGCCSGIAVQGAPAGGIASYEPSSGGTWLEVDYQMVSNEYAQSNNNCCN